MSKRLQVLVPDEEYREFLKSCRREAMTLAEWVRGRLREAVKKSKPASPEEKLSRLMKFAKYRGPTGDIDDMVREIESGKGVKL